MVIETSRLARPLGYRPQLERMLQLARRVAPPERIVVVPLEQEVDWWAPCLAAQPSAVCIPQPFERGDGVALALGALYAAGVSPNARALFLSHPCAAALDPFSVRLTGPLPSGVGRVELSLPPLTALAGSAAHLVAWMASVNREAIDPLIEAGLGADTPHRSLDGLFPRLPDFRTDRYTRGLPLHPGRALFDAAAPAQGLGVSAVPRPA